MTDRRTDPGPIARDPVVPDSDRAVRDTTEARQGRPVGRIRWVLAVGLLLVVIGFGISYLVTAG